jgi:polyisoprenoid-binding protein YceI
MTTSSSAQPDVAALPLGTGVWTLDLTHSGVNFQVRHLGVTNVRGRFDRFDGTLTVGDTLDAVSVTANIDMGSINTNQADRDAHLRSTDFFDLEKHPAMTFVSRSVSGGDDGYEVAGDLTIHGVTQPAVLDVEFFGAEAHPADGRTRAGFAATTEIRRSDFGIDFNMPLGVGKLALADKVKIELDLQFVAPE